MPKSAETYFYEFQTSAETDAAMSLLRSKEAFLYLALMATHLADGQIADGQTLAALVSEDLTVLGPAVRHDPDGPEAMLRKWTRKGWVHRSVDAETRIERYQLNGRRSPGCAADARYPAPYLDSHGISVGDGDRGVPADRG